MSPELNRDVGPRGRESFSGLEHSDSVHVIGPAGGVSPAMFVDVHADGEQATVLKYDGDGNPSRRVYVFPSDLLHPEAEL